MLLAIFLLSLLSVFAWIYILARKSLPNWAIVLSLLTNVLVAGLALWASK